VWPRTSFAEYSNARAVVESQSQIIGSSGPTPVTAGEYGALLVGLVGTYSSNCTFVVPTGFAIDTQAGDGDSSAAFHMVANAPGTTNLEFTLRAGSIFSAAFFALAITPKVAPVSVGLDGDYYHELTTGTLWGPRKNGVYNMFGAWPSS
jgi:hypothetical protein